LYQLNLRPIVNNNRSGAEAKKKEAIEALTKNKNKTFAKLGYQS